MTALSLPVRPAVAAAAPRLDLMPAPAAVEVGTGRLPITSALTIAIRGHDDARLRAALARALVRWEARTGLVFAHTPVGDFAVVGESAADGATLRIECEAAGAVLPTLGEDESYSLEISTTRAVLKGRNEVGVLRGLETLLQLLQSDDKGWFVPAMTVRDQPRFPWRGLMIDVCRHWQPIEVIKRNLDGMALVKLNVLHLHLTEDQGFRVESRKYPQLQEHGSDGHYFTQAQIREIIAYATERGIRVVPEFDIPGHATSWVVGMPELASGPGPFFIERQWGVFDPVLDPTNEKTYEVLDGFLGEMAGLFPDPYLHIGGDENNGKEWSANPRIQAFIRGHNLKDNAGLHAYFNRRLRDILHKYGKKLIGWDEILHPDLPKDSVIQSWRGAEGLAAAAGQGFTAILSNGYYIDLCHPAAEHYRNDPIPAGTSLTPEQQQRILGGEATMWSEWVTPETIDSRIWPRTAAIAERLWSPREVNDVGDMYRRLAVVSRRLEEAGLQHQRNRSAMIRRLAGDAARDELLAGLCVLADLVEPVKDYRRGREQPGTTQLSPLTGLPDCARPESDVARRFAADVESFLFYGEAAPQSIATLRARLDAWQAAARQIQTASASPRVTSDAAPLASSLAEVCGIAADAIGKLEAKTAASPAWRDAALTRLTEDAKPHAAVVLPVVGSIRLLVAAASLQGQRATLGDADWRAAIVQLAAPAKGANP